MHRTRVIFGFLLIVSVLTVQAMNFGEWAVAMNAETLLGTDPSFNTAFQDGCPALSRDGLKLFMASNRPGGAGGLDIWVSSRESTEEPWGAPANLGGPINTPSDEFCPTPLPNGHELLFVSTRPWACGGSDIYLAREHAQDGWQTPENLGCHVNSPLDEASPIIVEYENGSRDLYFSSTRLGGFAPEPFGATVGDSDIYISSVLPDGSVDMPVLASGVNTAAQDFRPNLRRDGLEMFFDSNRPSGVGGLDIWTATRRSPSEPWAPPVNLGLNVNSAANETRAFLSWGGTTLYFGSTRPGVEGVGDIFVTTRSRVMGKP
jgi:Tol biopolymer transport system component